MSKNSRLLLPITIVVASIIFGAFYYATQENKQQSIEKQVEIKAESDKLETEQKQKEYVVKRKSECYSFYEKEREKWNNVVDFVYSEVRDVCIVKYKSAEPARTEEVCKKIIENAFDAQERVADILFESYGNCLENWFSKEF